MELRQLRTFLTVATLLSFNRAADTLNYAQSTISVQIRALEEDLGVKLFDRLGKRVILTDAGERLAKYARKMLDMEAETIAYVGSSELSQGSLTIRAPQSIGNHFLPEIVAEFRRRFPGVSLDFTTCAFHGLEHELKIGVTDLAFLLAESITSASMAVEPLRFERLVMVSNPGHPLAEKPAVSIDDLASEPIFLPTADCGYRMLFEQMLTEARTGQRSVMEFNSVEMLKACLARSPGVAMMPEFTVRAELDKGTLSVLRWEDPYMETAILMIRHRKKWISPALKAFMDIARELIADDSMAPQTRPT